MKSQSIAIVGSGLAAYLFAKEFRKLDTTTPLEIITASDGAFYSKPLLSTALTNKKSAADLAIYTADEMAAQLSAQIHTATPVESVDPHLQIVLAAKKKITYQKLIIACGSHAITPRLQGDATSHIYSVNDLSAYGKFRTWINGKKHIAILGTGLVGCEFANDLANVGFQVEVISPDPYPLAKLVPQPVSYALQQALAQKGITWHFEKLATTINHNQAAYAVQLSDGNTLVVDGVFSAIGIEANCHLAKSIDIACNKGIKVDHQLRTNIENIYAVGDCAEVAGEVRQYVAPLLQSVKALASHLVGEKKPLHYPPMPIVTKTPACPIVACPPPKGIEGKWSYEGKGCDQSAVFHDKQGKIQGFALSGSCVRQRMLLTQQLPSLILE